MSSTVITSFLFFFFFFQSENTVEWCSYVTGYGTCVHDELIELITTTIESRRFKILPIKIEHESLNKNDRSGHNVMK